MMKIKYNVIVDAWLWQILVTGCVVGIFLITQTMPAIKLNPVQVYVSNKISTQRRWGWRGNYGVSGTGFLHYSPDAFEDLPWDLGSRGIGDSCSRQRVGSVQQRVGSVHYQFKLPLEIFIWEGIKWICTQQNIRREIHLICHYEWFIPAWRRMTDS